MPLELWTFFYHITHHNNLSGIFEHGILSWEDANARGLTQTDISDHAVQRRRDRREPIYNRSIHDYAPLYLNPRNAMLYVRRHIQHEIVILKVLTAVLSEHEHVFTDGNAASHNTAFSRERDVAEQSDAALRATRWASLPDGKRRCCAEVLVYPNVEPRFIVGVICKDQLLAKRIRPQCQRGIRVVIDNTLFY